MYRRPKFLEILLEIRREMAAEADYDVDLFAERVRSGIVPTVLPGHHLSADETGMVPPIRLVSGTIRPTRKRAKG